MLEGEEIDPRLRPPELAYPPLFIGADESLEEASKKMEANAIG
jgi:hypothetical protein